jgi:hypothetical protein
VHSFVKWFGAPPEATTSWLQPDRSDAPVWPKMQVVLFRLSQFSDDLVRFVH